MVTFCKKYLYNYNIVSQKSLILVCELIKKALTVGIIYKLVPNFGDGVLKPPKALRHNVGRLKTFIPGTDI